MRPLHFNHSDDPAAIFLAFKSGDELAFKYIFDLHHKSLYWIVKGILKDPEEAKDVVVKSFESLSRDRARINNADHIFRYLYIVARNEAIDQIRRLKLRQKVQSELAQFPQQEYREPLESEIAYARLMEKISLIVENLPRRRREIFQLYYYFNMNTRSIAKQMNIGEQTVRNQLSRAITYLRQALQ